MLPKKKRWAAAVHSSPTTCPLAAPSGLSTAPSPNRNQWSTTHSPIPNVSSRPLPRHQTPPGSTLSLGQPVSVAGIYQTAGLPTVSGSVSFPTGGGGGVRLGGMETGQLGSKQLCSFPPIRQINEISVNNPIPVSRGDFPASLITAIANNSTTDLLQQQSELLLQILPQEYLASYAQNFAKLANNNHLKNAYDHGVRGLVVTQPATDHSIANSKSTVTEAAAHSRQPGPPLGSPSHRSDSSDFSSASSLTPTAFHNTVVSSSGFTGQQQQQQSGLSRPKAPDSMKPTRTPTPVLRSMPSNGPVFPNSNSSSSRFSPNRRPSGSVDATASHHVTKTWPPPQQQQQQIITTTSHPQHLAGFDLSTLSTGVVRTSGLISTSSTARMDPATMALLSQWDSATQLALLSQNRDLTGLSDTCGRKVSTGIPAGGVSVSPSTLTSIAAANNTSMHSGNGLIDCSNSLAGHRIVGSPMDSKPRVNSDLLTNSRIHTTTSPLKSGVDTQTPSSRRQTGSKPSTSGTLGTGRSSDVMDRLAPIPTIPGTTDSSKTYRSTPPWLTMDNRMEPVAQATSSSVPPSQSLLSSLVSREQRVTESADTRFAILQDAKMAALNVDWPTPTGGGGGSGGVILSGSTNNTTNSNRVQRMRSSSSFSATGLSPSFNNPGFAPGTSSSTSTSSCCSAQPVARISSCSSSSSSSSSSPDEIRLISVFSQSGPSTKSTTCMYSHAYPHQQLQQPPQSMAHLNSQPNRYPQIGNSSNNTVPNRSMSVAPVLGRANGEYTTQVKTAPITTTTASFAPPLLSDPAPISHQKFGQQHQPLSTGGFDLNSSVPTGRPESGSRFTCSLPNQLPPSTSLATVVSAENISRPSSLDSNNHSNTSRGNTNSSTMPLKKRLIQRYEADNGTATADHNARWPQQLDPRTDVLCVQVHSPISPASQNSPFSPFPSTIDIKPQYTVPVKTQPPAVVDDKSKILPGTQAPEATGAKRKSGQNKSGRNKTQQATQQSAKSALNATTNDADRRQPVSKRSTGGIASVKRGNLKGTRKLAPKANSNSNSNSNNNNNGSDSYVRQSKSTGKPRAETSEHAGTATSHQRRRRPAEGSRRSRRNSSSASSATSWARVTGLKQGEGSEEPPRRRMAAVNGTLLMMVAARAQRSTSSASASSCSLHSMDADDTDVDRVDDDDDDEEEVEDEVEVQNVDGALADESSHSVCSSTASSRNAAASQSSSSRCPARPRSKSNRSTKQGSGDTAYHPNNTGDVATVAGHGRAAHVSSEPTRTKKPKRAAALAASAATAASATVGSKRIRSGSKRVPVGEAKRRRVRDRAQTHRAQEGREEEEEHEDEDDEDDDEEEQEEEEEDGGVGRTENEDHLLVDDESVNTTTAPADDVDVKSESAMALDELSAAMTEDKIPLDELLHSLPGPPNLANLTEHSLHPAHPLEYYKRSQTPFVQLVSCNDPGLKQVPKCRACRQLKGGAHFDASINGESGGVSDDGGGSEGTVSRQVATSTVPARDGQFKRPNGRNSHSEKTVAQESERPKSDKSRSRKSTSNTTSALSSSTAGSGLSNAASPVSVFCRFWGFRKLVFNNRGLLKLADFCHSTEASPADRSLWEMHHPVSPHLSVSAARYIIERAGMLFCRLLRQELAILTGNRNRDQPVHRGPGAPPKNGLRRTSAISAGGNAASAATTLICAGNAVAWKRPVKGVREMCDVCETTMFNTHWVCAKCGYSVCVHCCEEAKSRQKESSTDPDPEEVNTDRTKTKHSKARNGSMMGWSSCTTTRQHHDPERLLLTALLPASTVGKLLHRVHRIARQYQIRLGCGCLPSEIELAPPQSEDSLGAVELGCHGGGQRGLAAAENSSLDLLADLALQTGMMTTVKPKCEEPDEDGRRRLADGADSTTLLLDRRPTTGGLSPSEPTTGGMALPPHTWIHKPAPHPSPTGCPPGSDSTTTGTNTTSGGVDTLSTAPRTNPKYRVLQLHQPDNPGTLLAFQHEWRQNRPVIVSGCQDKFDPDLWSPRSFAEDFGSLRTPLVDCATGVELTRYPLRTFWEGFERKSKRLMNKDGRALCLKLKDWPTTDDFAELQPNRFSDLMSNLPMPEYTCREGQLNLASRLTSFFVCPDLGPKLYVAYGTGGSRSMGTTNLHVDIADAINILLYVGHPSDSVEESTANAEAVLNVMRLANVDRVFLERAMAWNRKIQSTAGTQQHTDEQAGTADVGPPGALWHIFLPEDMPAVREFLTLITEEESGAPLEPGSDPIHDQLFYLDQPLLDRLYACTGVLPCTIVQFRGDTVFIPAGAAHQVRNLNSCIKAAVDFVSPEHLPQCFQLIEEFRRLSSTHQNHEDKLQVKNMLFHAVKDALSVLLGSDPPTPGPTACKQFNRKQSADEEPFDCKLISLFDADRLASAQLISPGLMIKQEEENPSEHKPDFRRLSPCRVKSDRAPVGTAGFDWTGQRSNRTAVPTTRSNKAASGRSRYTPAPAVGVGASSPQSKSPRPPHSVPDSDTGHKLGTVTPSAPSPLTTHNGVVTGTLRCKSRPNQPVDTSQAANSGSSSNRTNLYDPPFLMDTNLQHGNGLTHRNGERDFVVSGSQLG